MPPSSGRLRQPPGQVERRDLEHRAGPFAVAGGDDRRLDVEEAAGLEERVDRRADRVADAGDRSERVRPRTQVGDLAQKLEAVPLLLQRIRLGVGRAEDLQRAGGQLDALPFAGALLELAGDVQAGAGRDAP